MAVVARKNRRGMLSTERKAAMTAYEFWRKRLQERDDDAAKIRYWTADQLV